jgi:hypothetical protein
VGAAAEVQKGQDPLGVQQPCTSIYSELLPGLTDVTDRVTYYSFGPWFAWAFAKRHPHGKASQFVEMLRRAEVLLTLIGSRHGLAMADGHFEEHGGSLVGVNTLRKVVEQTTENRGIKLSDYALIDESPQRYFKNRRGGLGQYYLGALREEYHLLDDAKGGVIDLPRLRPRPARAYCLARRGNCLIGGSGRNRVIDRNVSGSGSSGTKRLEKHFKSVLLGNARSYSR